MLEGREVLLWGIGEGGFSLFRADLFCIFFFLIRLDNGYSFFPAILGLNWDHWGRNKGDIMARGFVP